MFQFIFLALFIINHLFELVGTHCVFYDPISNKCNFCSYNFYDSKAFENFIQNSEISYEDCLPKLIISYERKVLILNKKCNSCFSNEFNHTYFDMIEAFVNESIIASHYLISKITFFISQGDHYILKSAFNASDSNYKLFRRLSANILIKPLFCSEYNLNEICSLMENPKIVIKTLIFSFLIAGQLEIQNLDFDAIDANYNNSLNDSCLNNDFPCCDQEGLVDPFNHCYLNSDSSSLNTKFEKNYYYALFQLEALYDNPHYAIPELFLSNVVFTNFHVVKSINPSFLSFASIDYFGGSVYIKNLTMLNSFFENSLIIFNDTFSLKKDFYSFNNFNDFLQNYESLNVSKNMEVNIDGFLIKDYNLYGLEQSFTLLRTSLILFQNFKGNILINNSKLSFISTNQYSSLFYIKNCAFLNSFSNVNFENSKNMKLFYIEQVNISIKSLTIKNSSWSNYSCTFLQSSQVFLNDFILVNSSAFQTSLGHIFLYGSNIQMIIYNNSFTTLTTFSMSFLNSFVSIINSTFNNLNMKKSELVFQNTFLNLIYSKWFKIFGFSTFFKFLEGNQLKLISNEIYELDGTYFIGGTSLSYVFIADSSFNNLINFNYLLNKATVFQTVIIINSSFSNISVNNALIYSVTTLNFSISSSHFENISLVSKKSTNFMCVQVGQELIQNSSFKNILFLAGGTAVINFKVSYVVVKNSQFTNCGFAYPINIAAFSSIEYVNLFYVWTCKEILFRNNSFLNQGAINLFSGFMFCTLVQIKITIDGNIFQYLNKTLNIYYTGLVILNAPIVIFTNNKFHNLQCPDHPSFVHNNGAVTLQGDNTYSPMFNNKIAVIANNLFFNCKCQKGGSFGLINYDSISINNLYFFNSTSTIGGSLIIVSSTFVSIKNAFCNYTSALQGHTIFLKNIFNIYFENFFIFNGFGQYGGFQVKNVQKLEINSVFVFNATSLENGAVLNLKDGQTSITNSFFCACQSRLTGGILFLNEKGNLSLFNITAYDVRSKMGGAIYIDSAIKVFINQSSFIRTFADLQGSSLLINLIQEFYLESTKFSFCESLKNGIIYLKNIENDAFYSLNKLSWNNNIANAGSCIFSEARGYLFMNEFEIENNINNCLHFISTSTMILNLNMGIIKNTTSNKNLIYGNNVELSLNEMILEENSFRQSLIYLENFKENKIQKISFIKNKKTNLNQFVPLIFCFDGKLNILKLEFLQASALNTWTYLISSKFCTIDLSNSTLNFQNNDFDALISMEMGSIYLNFTKFVETQGLIIKASDTNVTINNSFFSHNLKNDESYVTDLVTSSHFISNLMISIQNSQFFPIFGLSTLITNAKSIIYNNCSFNGLFFGQGIKIIDSLIVSINNIKFENLKNPSQGGAAIWISSPSKNFATISVRKSSFISNTACFAGAIYFQGLFNLTLQDSIFTNNSALKFFQSKCGLAGAALFQCGLYLSCFFIVRDNKFENNYADFMAPTLFSKSYLFEENNYFFNNSDKSNFTTKFVSYPLSIQLLNIQNVSSGTMFSLVFYLQDYFNQTFLIPRYSTSVLFKNSNEFDLVLKNTISHPTNMGVYNFSKLIISKTPQSFLNIEIKLSIFDEISLEESSFSRKFELFSRPCKIGELITKDMQCKLCQNTYFSIIDPMKHINVHQCTKCKENAYCPGGSFLIPMSGYWRFSSSSNIVVKCYFREACLGPPDIPIHEAFLNYDFYSVQKDFIHGTCLEGHEDNLCAKCVDGYGKLSNGICLLCSETEIFSYVKLAITVIAALTFSLLNIKALLAVQKNNSALIIGLVSKICINHLQKMAIMTSFNMKGLSLEIEDFFNTIQIVSLLNENNISNECLLRKFYNDSENFYIYKIFVSLIMPILESFLCIIVLMIFEIIMHFKKNKKSYINLKKVYLIFLISCFLFYPFVTKCSLSMINCTHLDDSETEYLVLSPNIICWQGYHKNVFFIIGFLGIFIWGLCFPIILGILIGRNFKKSDLKFKIIKIKNEPKRVYFPKMNESSEWYQFFCKDYKSQYYYWECIIFLQKFFLTLIPNLSELVGDKSDSMFLAVLFIYIFFLVKYSPFKAKKLNDLELFSMVTTCVTRVLLIFMNSYYMNMVVVGFCSITMIFINICFFLIALYYIYKYNDWKEFFLHYQMKIQGARHSAQNFFIGIKNQLVLKRNSHKEKS